MRLFLLVASSRIPARTYRSVRAGNVESGASEALILSPSDWRQPGGHCTTSQ